MSYEQRDNSGSLFRNDRKDSDKAPNSKGQATIGGKKYYVSGWTRRTKTGDPWISLAFEPVPNGDAHSAQKSTNADLDDIPF